MSVLPPDPVLREDLEPGDIGHIADHDEIHTILNGLLDQIGVLLIGTWADMQLEPPVVGTEYFTTDQELTYIGNGIKWLRTIGNPRDQWITDFGAVPSSSSPGGTVMMTNVAAFNSAVTAAQNFGAGNTKDVVVPNIADGFTYYINATISLSYIRVLGQTGSGYGQYSRAFKCTVEGSAIPAGSPVFLLTSGQTVEIAWISIYANTEGIRVRNFALWHVHDCSIVLASTADVNSSGLHVQNAFWGIAERIDMGLPTPAPNPGPGILLVSSFGEIINGVAQTQFREIIMGQGYVRFENRCTTGFSTSQSGPLVFHAVQTETIDGPFFKTYDAPGILYGHGITDVTMDHCSLIDIPTLTGKSFFDFNGSIAMSSWLVSACETYVQYLFKLNATLSNFEFNAGGSGLNADIFDPASGFGGNVQNLRIVSTTGVHTFSNQGGGVFPGQGEFTSIGVNVVGEAAPRWQVDERGKMFLATPATFAAPVNLPHGVAPITPGNGDMWSTTTGLFFRVNGVTQGPYRSAPIPLLKPNNSATIASAGSEQIWVSDTSPTNVTAITGMVSGIPMTISNLAGVTAGNTTIKHGVGGIHLKGGADCVLSNYDTITLVYESFGGTIREVSRSTNP